jgi:hypothetical protein
LTPEHETDALFDVLGRGELPGPGSGHAGDPAVRLLAALVGDVLDRDVPDRDGLGGLCALGGRPRLSEVGDAGRGRSSESSDGSPDDLGQRRSSVSMTPST